MYKLEQVVYHYKKEHIHQSRVIEIYASEDNESSPVYSCLGIGLVEEDEIFPTTDELFEKHSIAKKSLMVCHD